MGMPIRDTVVAAYKYSWLFWFITATPFGSYNTVQIDITIVYSDSTLGYIQSFPVSTSLENASMTHVKRDEEIWIMRHES